MRLRHVPLLVILAAPLPLASPLAAQATRCATGLLESFRAEHGIPGIALAVTRDDSVLFQATSGTADLESSAPVTAETLFQLSSTTRVLTSVLAMRLAGEGLLELDAPVVEHLPEAPSSWAAVTVRHLLSNTSGLPDVLAQDPERADSIPVSALLTELAAMAPEPSAGERWAYNLTDYLLLQAILERVGGQPIETLMRDRLFEPAGMTRARYWRTSAEVVAGSATGYYPDTMVAPPRHERREFLFPRSLLAAAGAAVSLDDLLAFDAALRQGRLLDPARLDEMWRDTRLADGRVVSYGLGWDTKTHAPGHRSAGHSGGFLTTFRTYPGSDLTVSVLTNGFLRPVNLDDVATAFAAVWDPAIVGFDAPACSVADLDGARF